MKENLGKLYLKKYKDINLEELLVNMSNDDINQILLEIYRQRCQNISEKSILEKYNINYDYFGPGSMSLKKTMKYNLLFLNSLPKSYDTIELSMINPLGTNSRITCLSQNMILSTIKNSEVCGDPTTALTLESCKRRKKLIMLGKINEEVNLATVQKVLRMQKFDTSKGYMQHFDLFALVSSGRKQKNKRFDVDKIYEHIEIWLKLCDKLKKKSFNLGKIEVGITDIDFVEHLVRNNYIERKVINENSFNEFDLFKEECIDIPKKIKGYNDFSNLQCQKYELNFLKKRIEEIENNFIKKLSSKYKDVNFYIEMDRKGGLGYYDGLCFHIYSNNGSNIVPLCDGGVTDWNAKLLSDKKEISVTSGFGAELVLKLFSDNTQL